MKTRLLIAVLFLIGQVSFSQNCEAISPYQEGMTLEYTNYNKKGKVRSVESYTVKSVDNEDGRMVIRLETTINNGKKKTNVKHETLRCENGNFYIDMTGYLAHQNEDQKSTLELKAEGDFVEFPAEMNTGMELEDGNIELKLGDAAADFSLANMKVYNRKVLDDTSLTTKAGTFDGYKVSFDYLFDMGIIKLRGSGIEWYVKGIGIVKSESYSKKGKLRWTRELTKMDK